MNVIKHCLFNEILLILTIVLLRNKKYKYNIIVLIFKYIKF